MELRELTTPFQKKQIICYQSDCITPVIQTKLLKHIGRSVYKGKDKNNGHGQTSCRIYVYYDSLNIGVDVGPIYYPDSQSADYVIAQVENQHFLSPESAISELDRRVSAGDFIPTAWIEFARHAAPDRVEVYTKARKDYLEQCERDREAKKAESDAKDAAYCSEKNEKAQLLIDAALGVIRNGGTLRNDSITFYRSRYHSSSYKIINHLSRLYHIQFPLKVQGWINHSLCEVTIQNGTVSCYTSVSRSTAFYRYMNQLITAVKAGDPT